MSAERSENSIEKTQITQQILNYIDFQQNRLTIICEYLSNCIGLVECRFVPKKFSISSKGKAEQGRM